MLKVNTMWFNSMNNLYSRHNSLFTKWNWMYHHPLFCRKYKTKGTPCIWSTHSWQKRLNLVLFADHVGYIESPKYECEHGTTHTACSHSFCMHKYGDVSEDLIKIDRHFVSESCVKLQSTVITTNANIGTFPCTKKYNSSLKCWICIVITQDTTLKL